VGHKEQCAVALIAQNGGQSLVARHHRAFHRVAFQDTGKTVERGENSVVRMISCRVEIGKTERMLIERIEVRRQMVGIAKTPHEFSTHRLHQHHHHVLPRGFSLRLDAARQGRNARQSLSSEVSLHIAHRLIVVHEVEALILRPRIIERRAQ